MHNNRRLSMQNIKGKQMKLKNFNEAQGESC